MLLSDHLNQNYRANFSKLWEVLKIIIRNFGDVPAVFNIKVVVLGTMVRGVFDILKFAIQAWLLRLYHSEC